MLSTSLRRFSLSLGVLCLLAAGSADAQRRSRSSSTLSWLRSSTVKDEVGISEDQAKKIQEVYDRRRPTDEFRKPYYDKIKAAADEKSRESARAELSAAEEKYTKDREAEALGVLTEQQKTRFGQVRLRMSGTRALTSDEVVAELKITDEQKKQLSEIGEQQRNESRSKGVFRLPSDQQKKFNDEWNAKFVAVLTPTQRDAWTQKLGPPLKSEGGTGASTAGTTKSATPSTTPSTTPAAPAAVTRPRVDTANKSYDDVVASFAPTNGAKRPAGTNGKEKMMSFHFEGAPWKIVLEDFAKQAGMSLDLSDYPPDTFSYRDANLYTVTQALDVLNGYLLPKKFILLKRNNFLVVQNLAKGLPPSLIPDVDLADLAQQGENQMIRVVIPLKQGVAPAEAATEVQGSQLVSEFGKVAPLTSSNAIVVTDIGGNVRRVYDLLSNAIEKVDPNAIVFKSFNLEHIAAYDAEKLVRSQLGLSAGTNNVSTAGSGSSRSGSSSSFSSRMEFFRSRFGGSSDRGSSDRGRSSSRSSGSSSTGNTGNVKVTGNPRTNTLMVNGPASQMKIVEEIVKTIDVPASPDAIARNQSNQPELRVYKVTKVDAGEVAKTLTELVPGVVINEDRRAGTIHINATPDEHNHVARLIREMDGGGSGGMNVSVVPVRRLDPIAVANTLVATFQSDGDSAPSIQADSQGRQLIVRGSLGQITQIKQLVTQLEGEGGAGSYAANDPNRSGNMRVLKLGGRDPAQFVRTLEAMWNSRTGNNPIRISVPSYNPVQERRTPGRPVQNRNNAAPNGQERPNEQPKSRPKAEQPKAAPKKDGKSARLDKLDDGPRTVTVAFREEEPVKAGKQPAKTDAKPAEKKSETKAAAPTAKLPNGKAPIMIMLRDGDLIIASDDTEALDRLQSLIDTMIGSMPNRQTWTVLYLRVADATEVATMLEKIFPTSSVAASSGGDSLLGSLGLNNIGQTVMDATGLASLGADAESMQIIPDPRSNSLWVSGPAYRIRELENVVKVLDADELPDSLRDRMPRMIPVKYADVNEVADIVRELYKDFMQAARGGNQQNPLAMLMAARGGGGGGRGGRGGGGNSNRQQQQAKLQVAVDHRTSQLLVSANESLYRQITALVEAIDAKALAARPVVNVIRPVNVTSTMITDTLPSMLPNVQVSVTAGASRRQQQSRTQQGSQNGNGSDRGRGGDDGANAMQQMMMMRAMQNRGGGSTGFGRGGSTGRGGFDPSSFSRGSGRSSRGGFDFSNFGRGGSSRGGSGRSRGGR